MTKYRILKSNITGKFKVERKESWLFFTIWATVYDNIFDGVFPTKFRAEQCIYDLLMKEPIVDWEVVDD